MPDRSSSPAPSGARTDVPSVWVLGATGYSGLEAVRLLASHPVFRLTALFASPGSRTRDLADVDPRFSPGSARALPWSGDGFDPNAAAAQRGRPDAALLALPDEASREIALQLVERGVRVVDLSAAFRPKPGGPDPRPAVPGAVYGLAEWESAAIARARLVANPGCYATAALLGLLPLLRAGLADTAETIVVDGKSGVTGAGRKLEPAYLFAEANENCRPYALRGHRHLPEMRAVLGLTDDRPLLFAPHVLPLSRGLMTTCYVRLRGTVAAGDVSDAFEAAYAQAPAVRLLRPGPDGHPARLPEIRGVAGTGRCDIGWSVDPDHRNAIVVSAIDNLLKGAASQAVQNLNLMFGRPREEGVPL